MTNLLNFALFQVGWFALVLSVPAGIPLAGMAVSLLILAAHLRWLSVPGEWLLIAMIGACGWMWESLLYVLGIVDHLHGYSLALVSPPWMAMLWMNFAITLNHSLSWLKGQWLYAVLLGATGGPLAFWAGARLGAIGFGDELTAMAVLSLAWALLSPAAVGAAMAFDPGQRRPEEVRP